ncbi:hypothetical protein THTE_0902 [Thermogutta terrifontis]|uniref:Uncharacterized protein n=1 Tax=Thermogutta terrifontis TaxID=1331910 RepID=A0A286RC25_9BACT|nr:hypothetical protein THTE_0902 [Thermogutta terrifontis]
MCQGSAVPFATPTFFWTGLKIGQFGVVYSGGACLSRPYFLGGTRLSGPINTNRCPIALHRARQACPSELPEGPACHVRFLPVGAIHESPDNSSGPWRVVAK